MQAKFKYFVLRITFPRNNNLGYWRATTVCSRMQMKAETIKNGTKEVEEK